MFYLGLPTSIFINYLTFYMGTRAAVAESRQDFYDDILEVMPTILFETKRGLARHSKYCSKAFKCPDYISFDFAEFLMDLCNKECLQNWVLYHVSPIPFKQVLLFPNFDLV